MNVRKVVILSIVFLALSAGVAFAVPSVESSKFEVSKGCMCHSARIGEWEGGMHAKALVDPIYRVKLEEAVAASPGIEEFCESCHTPIGMMAGEVKGADISGISDQGKEGVSCDFCHMVTGTIGDGLGNASYDVVADGVKKAQLEDAVSPAHGTLYSEFHHSAEFCGNCHNVSHPLNGTHLESTYDEWKESPWAEQGVTCQDCHMTPGPGVTKPNPGTAAAGGPERDMIYNMTFAGANMALGNADLAEANLKAAATMEQSVERIVPAGQTVKVATTITNVGAGHYLPTGLTEFRQMWLQVTATDASGEEVFSGRRDFVTVLEDKDGNFPAEMWEATAIKSDDRIPAGESVTQEYEFEMPEGAVKVESALYYASVPEDLAKKAGVDVPTVLMVSASGDVFSSEDAANEAPVAEEPQEPATPDVEDPDQEVGVSYLPIILAIVAALAVIALAWYLIRRRRAGKSA